jgi:uncharacterized protein YqeY
MAIIEQINEGIKEAIRSKNSLRLDVLRMLKSKILAADARAALPDADVIKLFKTYYGNLEESLEFAKMANRPDLIEKTQNEIKIVQEFLPKILSLEETKKVVREAIAESGAKTAKDLGMVMKNVMKRNLAVDAKLVKDLIADLLKD